jgi:hypothetical protein
MRRTLRLVPLLLLCTPALAQTTLPTCWMWARPSPQPPAGFPAVPVVNIGAEGSAYDAVYNDLDYGARIQIETGLTSGYLHADKNAIVLRGFGNWGLHPSSIQQQGDAISPPPIWEDPNNPPGPNDKLRYMQPWMQNGAAGMQQWMTDFLNYYSEAR